MRWVPLLLAWSLLWGSAGAVEPGQGPPTASFAKGSETGFSWTGTYTISGGGTGLAGWTLTFDVPAHVKVDLVTNGWAEQDGVHVAVHPQAWAATVPPGASIAVGLKGSEGAPWGEPTACRLNGFRCSGVLPPVDTSPPSIPPELRVAWSRVDRIGLAWGASTDNDGVDHYEIRQDGIMVAASTEPRWAARDLARASSHTFSVRAVDASGNPSGWSAPLTASSAASPEPITAFRLAPYVDVTSWPPFDVGSAVAATGNDRYTLAFVIGQNDGCKASWGGVHAMEENFFADQVWSAREVGGDVIASFGGAAGRELAQACPDVASLAAEYRAVIQAYKVHYVDFDVEGAALADTAANARRSDAIALLQAEGAAAGTPLLVSFTLPVFPSGLTPPGLDLLANARARGVQVDRVNVMAMDYGQVPPAAARLDRADPLAPWRVAGPDMGEQAIAAARSVQGQLRALDPTLTEAQAWQRVAVTPMIGQNDVADEVFYLDDARDVAAFADGAGVGMLSFWSLGRDRPCHPPQATANGACSGISQLPFDFTKAFTAFVHS